MADFTDPYIDPETGILRNLVGAKTQAELDLAESEHAVVRLTELQLDPVRITGDARQLREIHRRLFVDIFDWAGQFRVVDINKGGTDFMPVSRVELGAQNALAQLADENGLKGLPRDSFIRRLAFHYEQINYLHPFREGNGRTQRVFWQQIAKAAGYPLNFMVVLGSVNDFASRAAASGDIGPLVSMLGTAVGDKLNPTASPGTGGPGRGRRPAGSPSGAGGQYIARQRSEPEITLDPEG